jgi:hypothetical protein
MAHATERGGMVDDQYRGLLTEREREILAGEADVSDNYRYRVVSRVRTKIENVGDDVDVLAQNRNDLLEELREVVCQDAESIGIAESDSSGEHPPDDSRREREPEPSQPEQSADVVREAAEEAVERNWKQSWEGHEEGAVEALVGLHDRLAELPDGQQRGDFLEMYSEYQGPYPIDEDDEEPSERGGWWRHFVRECLEELPGVERYGQNGRKWRYTGADR